jgi:oligopeptide/dipeptide ABC transporter ATP-binding protein
MTALQMVAEVFRHWDGLNPASAKNAAKALLKEVGLSPEVFDVRPARLSGGQCQRIGIARALACRPSVLIADEPTSALDVSVQAQILNLLMDLRESRGLALLFVSHDLRVVRWITDYLVVLYGGVIVEEGPTEELFDRPFHPYTRALVASLPGRSAAGAAVTIGGGVASTNEASERGCIFAARCPHVTADCEVAQPPLIQMLQRRLACLHPIVYSGEEPSAAWS